MPGDANPAGDIFGGGVMWQMDLAAFTRAREIAKGKTVTAAVKEMAFKKPVKVGDTLSIFTTVDAIGCTSLRVRIEAWAHCQTEFERDKVTEAIFVIVAVNDESYPRPVQ